MTRHVSVPCRVVVGLAGALLLAGCGQQANQPSSAPESEPATIGSCAPDSAAITGATPVASVDLDGDGTPERVSLTAASAIGCASYVVAKVAGRMQGAALGDATPDGADAWQAVTVPGRTGQLLVVRSTHPRGGFQDTLFGAAGATFGPVVDASKQPLALPFVATDTAGGYVSVSCVDGGFVVREAVAHDPIGVAPAYDVRETAYRLSGLTATAAQPTEVADNVLPDRLPADYPELVRREAFTTGCSA